MKGEANEAALGAIARAALLPLEGETRVFSALSFLFSTYFVSPSPQSRTPSTETPYEATVPTERIWYVNP